LEIIIKKIHVSGFLRDKIDKFIPLPLLKTNKKIEDWEKDIFQEHARIAGLKKTDAMTQYLNKVRQWHFYGSTFWTVQTINKENSALPDQVILAVSSSGIQLLKVQGKEPILIQRYADIYSWAYKKMLLLLFLVFYLNKNFNFQHLLEKILQKHYKLMLNYY